MKRTMLFGVVACVLLATSPAFALADPTFDYDAAKPTNDEVVWSSQAKAGMLLTTGNSETASLSGGFSVARRTPTHQLSGEANLAWARSELLIAADLDGSGTIDPQEIQRVAQTTTQGWGAQARYDRFFAVDNSLYGAARASADEPAGKEIQGGAQVGYSRRLFDTALANTSAELGYDFSYEKYVNTAEPVAIHSARAAILHRTKISDTTLINLDTEVLVNLNEEVAPNPNGTNRVAPLKDYRINAAVGLTTRLFARVSLGLNFKLRYDNVPAPRAPLALPWAPGFVPFAERLDTSTEASLIFTFL